MLEYNDFVSDEEFEKQLEKALAQVKETNHGFFGPDSVLWKLMKKIFPLYMGSTRLLILQSIHIWMAQAGKDASYAFSQPMNRAYRTYVSVSIILYGTVDEALAVARFIRKMHENVKGEINVETNPFPDKKYQANEGNALLWVHASLWESIIYNYEALNKTLSYSEKEQLIKELRVFAYLFGVPDHLIPTSWERFLAYNNEVYLSPVLGFENTHQEMVNFFLDELEHTMPKIFKPFFDFHKEYTINTLPENIRNSFSLTYSPWKSKLFLRIFRLVNRFLIIPSGYNEYYVNAMARITQNPFWKLCNNKWLSPLFATSLVWGMRTAKGSRFKMPQLKDGKVIS